VREHGVLQFLATYDALKGLVKPELKWGEEMEFGIFKVRARVCVCERERERRCVCVCVCVDQLDDGAMRVCVMHVLVRVPKAAPSSGQPRTQSTNQSINQSIDQSTNQSTNQSITPHDGRSTTRRARWCYRCAGTRCGRSWRAGSWSTGTASRVRVRAVLRVVVEIFGFDDDDDTFHGSTTNRRNKHIHVYTNQAARGNLSSAPGWWSPRPTAPTVPTPTTSYGNS
jgi:hypothetical protein